MMEKIIIYDFRYHFGIFIYNEKTFKELFEIDRFKIINDFKEENRSNNNKLNNNKNIELEDDVKDLEYFWEQKFSIKEIDNGLILIGLTKYLIELKIQDKICDNRVIKKLDDNILDINKLLVKGIIIFTNKSIIILNKKEKEYIINDEYQLKDDWKMFLGI